jgi:Flp pilus assembly protein TadG
MQRLNKDDGAVAVIVALVLLVMVGIGALVMDVGNLYWERRSLQNGADAAALAAAQDLAAGEATPTAYASARHYADANNSRGAHVRPSDDPDEPGFVVTSNAVTVTTRTGSPAAEGELTSILANVLGVSEYATSATATASWGTIGGAATLPITFSYCEWENLVGDVGNPTLPTGPKTLQFLSPGGKDCAGPAGHYAPAGWGWLGTNETGDCVADIDQNQIAPGQQGQGVPSFGDGCTGDYFKSLIGRTVLMPIFEEAIGPGNNTEYRIAGFAAVEIEGYRLHPGGGPGGGQWAHNPPCGNSTTCIRANFVDFVSLGDAVDFGGGPDFGTSIVALTG